MATFKATTRIKASSDKTFEVGEVVSGLDKEAMKGLWEAGALERVDEPEPKESEEEAKAREKAAAKAKEEAKEEAEAKEATPKKASAPKE